MPEYLYNVNVDENGNHEVHTTNCNYLPSVLNQKSLGWHTDCKEAISYAKRVTGRPNFDGCFHCCSECHKG